MTVRGTRGRGLTRICCSSLEALNAYHPLFVCTSQFSPRTDKDEGTNTPAHLFLGRLGFPSMLERSMAACLKVLFLLFLSLALSLPLSHHQFRGPLAFIASVYGRAGQSAT